MAHKHSNGDERIQTRLRCTFKRFTMKYVSVAQIYEYWRSFILSALFPSVNVFRMSSNKCRRRDNYPILFTSIPRTSYFIGTFPLFFVYWRILLRRNELFQRLSRQLPEQGVWNKHRSWPQSHVWRIYSNSYVH